MEVLFQLVSEARSARLEFTVPGAFKELSGTSTVTPGNDLARLLHTHTIVALAERAGPPAIMVRRRLQASNAPNTEAWVHHTPCSRQGLFGSDHGYNPGVSQKSRVWEPAWTSTDHSAVGVVILLLIILTLSVVAILIFTV